MDQQQEAVLLALLNAQARAREHVETNVVGFLHRLIVAMRGRWYDDRAVADFKTEVIGVVRNGQEVLGDATGAYLDQVLDELDVPTAPGDVQLPDPVRKVDPVIQWERPAKEYRRARLLGVDDLAAQEQAEQRARTMAKMDLDLAVREAARQRIAPVDKIRGYRRILHPELSKHGSCGLCMVAADRIYHKQQLLPLHNGCNCGVLPIIGANDPGKKLNDADLGRIYDAAGGTDRKRLQRVRVTVVEHGELGPVLVAKGDHFRDAEEAAADVRSAS